MNRIIHVLIRTEKSPGRSNVERLIYALAREERSIDLDVSLWCIGEPQMNTADNIEVKYFPLPKNQFMLNRTLKEELENLPAGFILHLHGGFTPLYFSITRYIKKSGKLSSLILSPHGQYNASVLARLPLWKKVYYNLFERYTLRQTSLVHLIGSAEEKGYRAFMKQGAPFVCLPYGKSPSVSMRSSVGTYDGSSDPFIITFNGHINLYSNGLDVLLKSFARFSNEVYSQVELWIIGEGEDIDDAIQMAETLAVGEKVKFMGALTEQERDKLLQQSHVFIHPLRSESNPVPALEAASLGIPLIVTEETNLCSFVKKYNAGWCLEQNSVENLLPVLHEAYIIYKTDHEAYKLLNYNSFRMIREELNWKTQARKWKEVYLGLS